MTERFRDRDIAFGNGVRGENLTIPSHNPLNYYQILSDPHAMPKIEIDGKLFLPKGAVEAPLPCVIVAPGSLGVAPSHLAHAETLTGMGFAAFMLDSFGARQVTSTVANQTQFSFAASALDVLRTFKVLAARPEIDAARIGAQGHSRGGTAVLMAASRKMADAVIGDAAFAGVYAAYPWSGHQFLSPQVGQTQVRSIHGGADEWCSPQQVQGHMQAIRLTGGNASFRLLDGVHHSFDRGAPIVDVPEASVSPAAPTAYLADDGAFFHPLSDRPDPNLVDRDLMLWSVKSGFGQRGARIGGNAETAELFREDMMTFWQDVLG